MNYKLDTIVAISTPPGYGGISVIRLSGENALYLAKKHFVLPKGIKLSDIVPKRVYYGYFVDEKDILIDECLLLYMKSPNSYTGEDVIEFQCHGGNIVSVKIVEELLKNTGIVRYAEPGEFTYRAFLHGKRDLTQAEAVESLIHSRTVLQQRNALKQLTGYLGKKLKEYFDYFQEKRLILEAVINFPEDVDVTLINIENKLKDFSQYLDELMNSYREISPFIAGIKAIIIGKPNVGKSSFMNLLLNNERVIVSPYPGTTRDIIEETIILEGVPLKIIDTAGIRFTNDPVESIGIEKTKEKIQTAQVVFAIFDVSDKPSDEDREILKIIEERENVFVILNKIDRGINSEMMNFIERFPFKLVRMSILENTGFEEFKKMFKDSILKLYSFREEKEFYVTTPRHYEIFVQMKEVIEELLSKKPQDEELLFALSELISLYDKLMGRNISEDDINKIFSRFCIGK